MLAVGVALAFVGQGAGEATAGDAPSDCVAFLRGIAGRVGQRSGWKIRKFNPPSPHPKGCPDGLNGAWARGSAKSFADFRAWPKKGRRLSDLLTSWFSGMAKYVTHVEAKIYISCVICTGLFGTH